ncbi:MAG TPA: hypothetical protein VMY18_04365 [Acidobacteriota bacterium]|nr:hypothetical protein [Acidobacteriota bacterium]
MLGETPVGFPQQLVSQSQIGFGVSKVAVAHIGGQKGQFGIDEEERDRLILLALWLSCFN